MEHGYGRSNSRPALLLCNPILLRVVWNCQILDAFLHTEVLEGVRGVLTSNIRPQCLDLSPYLVLNKSFELLEPTENLVLIFLEIDPSLPGEVVKVT